MFKAVEVPSPVMGVEIGSWGRLQIVGGWDLWPSTRWGSVLEFRKAWRGEPLTRDGPCHHRAKRLIAPLSELSVCNSWDWDKHETGSSQCDFFSVERTA